MHTKFSRNLLLLFLLTWLSPISLTWLSPNLAAAQPEYASGVDDLIAVLEKIKVFDARFEQWVIDEGGQRLQEIQGHLQAARPYTFRWQTYEPFPQLIIADGKQLWIYDEDLLQVTRKPLGGRLDEIPALLLSGDLVSGDLGKIDSVFFVTAQSTEAGSTRFTLIPKAQDQGFEHLVLEVEQGRLKAMQMIDALGQRTLIEFSQVRLNKPIKADRFKFDVPDGVDLIDETLN